MGYVSSQEDENYINTPAVKV